MIGDNSLEKKKEEMKFLSREKSCEFLSGLSNEFSSRVNFNFTFKICLSSKYIRLTIVNN